MTKTLIALFTDGRVVRLVKFESSGATTIFINDWTYKCIASGADTNYALGEVRGFTFIDSWFE